MAEDRAKLLRSLAIDRGKTTAVAACGKVVAPKLLASGAVAIAALVAGLWFLLPQFWGGGRTEQRASVSVPRLQPCRRRKAPRAPAAEPRHAGGLSASGYVVARRKATVAAEITGKVVELFVDEGMVVQAGQVVARLDSVLAETDLNLAQSQAVAAAEAAATAIAADLRDAERIFGRSRACRRRALPARPT